MWVGLADLIDAMLFGVSIVVRGIYIYSLACADFVRVSGYLKSVVELVSVRPSWALDQSIHPSTHRCLVPVLKYVKLAFEALGARDEYHPRDGCLSPPEVACHRPRPTSV